MYLEPSESHLVAWILPFNFGQFRPRYVQNSGTMIRDHSTNVTCPIVADGSGTSSEKFLGYINQCHFS